MVKNRIVPPINIFIKARKWLNHLGKMMGFNAVLMLKSH